MGWRFIVLTLVLSAVTQALAKPSLLPGGSDEHHHHEHDTTDNDYYDDNSDRSYKFGFDADGYSREEEADENGNVVGKFSYTDSDGVLRSLSYKAGANIGFVPEAGNLLDQNVMAGFSSFGQKTKPEPLASPTTLVKALVPPPEKALLGKGTRGKGSIPPENTVGYPAPVANPVKFYARAPPAQPLSLYEAPPQPSSLYEAPIAPTLQVQQPEPTILFEAPANIPAPVAAPKITTPQQVAPAASIFYQQPTVNMDNWELSKAYKFGYSDDSDDSGLSRSEEADEDGNVKGMYSYINPLGEKVVVHYSASADRGFVIESEEIAGEAPQQDDLPEIVSVDDDAIDIRQYANEDQLPASNEDVATIFFEQPEINQDTWIQSKAYRYGFSGANDLSRSEVADDEGAVFGTYTIPDINGEPLIVRYKAGPKTGYVIENLDEVRRRTVPSSEEPIIPTSQAAVITLKTASIAQEEPAQDPFVDPLAIENADKSYQFSYGSEEEGNLREEASDANGNIKGRYSYVNAEGNTITVQYSAGAEKGFVIENEQEVQENVAKATHAAAVVGGGQKDRNSRMRVVKRRRTKSLNKPFNPNRRRAY